MSSVPFAFVCAVAGLVLAASPRGAFAASTPESGGGRSVAVVPVAASAGKSPARARVGEWRPPVPGRVVRAFAPPRRRFAAGGHRGLDLAASPGAPVRAACGGRVAFGGAVPGVGRVVAVVCGRWRVTYGHLLAVQVAPGVRLRRGDQVGRAGRSGRPAPGPPHVHFAVRRADRRSAYVDPARFLARAAPRGPGPVAAPRGDRPRGDRPRGDRPRGPSGGPAARRPAPAPLPARAGSAPARQEGRPPAAVVGALLALLAFGAGAAPARRGRRRAGAAATGRRAAPAPRRVPRTAGRHG